MISYRLKGFVNLYVVTVALVGLFGFLLYSYALPFLYPAITFTPNFSIFRYSVGVVAGLLLSARYLVQSGDSVHRLSWTQASRIASRQTVFVALAVFAISFATKDRDVSRVFVSTFLIVLWLLLLVSHIVLPGVVGRIAFQEQHLLKTIFIGDRKKVSTLQNWIENKRHLGVQSVGYLSDDSDDIGSHGKDLRWLGRVASLEDVLESQGIGQVIVLGLPSEDSGFKSLIEVCQEAGCRLLFHTNLQQSLVLPFIPVLEGGDLFLSVRDEPLEDPFNRALKRLFDIVVSFPVVICILPVLSVVVKILQSIQAPGPLFFVRPRGGQRRTEFPMLKYRSMYFAQADGEHEARQAKRLDERVYPFGRFLRKSSLDEFPQFFNVLKGEMSIVGPRPHLPMHDFEFAKVAKAYRSRHLVKPGITGLAQVSGFRGEITDPEMLKRRVHMDLSYITMWSIWLDFQITLKTLWQIFFPPKSAF